MTCHMAGNPIDKVRTFLFGKVLGLERHEYMAVAWSFAYFFCCSGVTLATPPFCGHTYWC